MPTAIFTARALIRGAAGDTNELAGSWEVSDDLGSASRGFNVQMGGSGQLQIGSPVVITAGYDEDRVTLIRGEATTVQQTITPSGAIFNVQGEDLGISEILQTPITFVWEARPPSVLPRAHAILREAAAQIGVNIGSLAFPDYPLYASYVAHQKSLFQIVQDLMEPWNVFASIQHFPDVRDKVLSVLRVDWANPPNTGYAVTRARHSQHQISQRKYDDQPRLAHVIGIEIRGAAYTQPRPDLGPERRYNYVNRRINRELLESVAGTYEDFVWLEIYTLEEREEGKVILTEERHYQTVLDSGGFSTGSTLLKRIITNYEYYHPEAALNELVAFEPITLRTAILWSTIEEREELQNGNFDLVQRTFKQYFHNDDGEQIAEQESVQEYDTAAGRWKPARVVLRTHSQTHSSGVRTQISAYLVDPDNDNELTTDFVDSQLVGGQLPTANSQLGRDEVQSIQVVFPPLPLVNGIPTEGRRSSNAWIYENAYIGSSEAQQIFDLATQEQELQLTPVRWETVNFDGTFDPNLWAGQPLQVEVAPDIFVSYWIESVQHRFDVNGGRTSGTARRLTESVPLDPTVATVAAPTNLLATAISTTEIQLTWTDNASNESSYRVERSLDQVVWTEIAILPPNSTSYLDVGLTPSTTYSYRVRAFALI